MPASEVTCPECPDDNGGGAVTGGDDFSIRIGNKILSFANGEIDLSDVQSGVPDGVYSQVTLFNGQIVDASDLVPTYTPQACCDGGTPNTGGGNNTIPILAGADNLLKVIGGEYYVKPVFTNSTTVTTSGSGTTNDPYTFEATATGGSSTTVTAGDDIEVTAVTGGFQVSQVDSAVGNTTFMGMDINATGHVVATDAGVEAAAVGTHDFAGISVTINAEGRVTNLTGTHNVGTGGTGLSGTGITAGTFTTADGKTVAYSSDGLITSVT